MNLHKWTGILKASETKKEKVVRVMSIDDEPANIDWLHGKGEKNEDIENEKEELK